MASTSESLVPSLRQTVSWKSALVSALFTLLNECPYLSP